jgi:copper homeostasis protein (lipoprotein)
MTSLHPTDRLAGLRGASLLALAWLLAAVTTPPATAQPASAPQQAAASDDATYAGTLPCADCAGQQIVLTLFADQSFRMHTRYLGVRAGHTQEVRDLGRWGNIDAGTLELRGGRDAPLRFSPQPGGALRLLDTRGLPIASTLNYELARQAEIDRLGGPTRLRGMYLSMADAASLTECLTGKRWPVLIEGEHPALELAYLVLRSHPGHPVLAVLTASFVWREPEPGLHPREVLRVEAFERLWPGETCAAEAPATAALLVTRWRVVEIVGDTLQLRDGRGAVRVRFEALYLR